MDILMMISRWWLAKERLQRSDAKTEKHFFMTQIYINSYFHRNVNMKRPWTSFFDCIDDDWTDENFIPRNVLFMSMKMSGKWIISIKKKEQKATTTGIKWPMTSYGEYAIKFLVKRRRSFDANGHERKMIAFCECERKVYKVRFSNVFDQRFSLSFFFHS